MEAEVAQRPDDPDGDEVLAGEDGRRRVRAQEQLARGGAGSVAVGQAPPLERPVVGQAGAGQRLAVAAAALRRREDRRAVAEEGDAPMTGGDQVLDGGAGAADVVGQHRIGVDESGRPVHEDQRRAAAPLALEVALIATAGHDDQAVDAARRERLDELALALLVLVGRAGEGEGPVVASDVLDAPVDRREERVRDVAEDQAQAARLPVGAAQRAGRQVPPVAEDLDRVTDADGEILAHVPAVDDARDGRDAHAGDARDVLHRGSSRGRGGHGRTGLETRSRASDNVFRAGAYPHPPQITSPGASRRA